MQQPVPLSTTIERIRRPKLSDQVALRIEALMVDGSFPPGSLLPPERELMQLFGIGRPSIREALFALNRMGLVAISSGERARVTAPTPDRLITELSGAARYFLTQPGAPAHFQEARALFEVGVARLAAVRRTPEELARLEQALRLNDAARGDAARFGRTDVGFHYALAAMTGNPIFTAVHDALAEWLTAQRTIALRAERVEAAAFAAHERIFNAVQAGDPDGAGAAMAQHLAEIGQIIRQETDRQQTIAAPKQADGDDRK